MDEVSPRLWLYNPNTSPLPLTDSSYFYSDSKIKNLTLQSWENGHQNLDDLRDKISQIMVSEKSIDSLLEEKNEHGPGLKRGGVLNIVRRKVELRCPSEKIPENLVIDLDGVEIGESFKISSINLETDVTPTIKGRDFVIATLAAPTVMKEPEKPAEAEAAEGEAGAEAAAEGDKPAAEGEKKEGDDKKAAEENK